MIRVDRHLCAYCGACVGVCPVDALLLEETHLRVRPTCTSCGRCIEVCPMGALRLPAVAQEKVSHPKQAYDIVVIGAGPAGSTAARFAAEGGASVLLLDRRQEIGPPVQCAEGIAREQLTDFIEPDPRWISAVIRKARIIANTSCNGSAQELEATGGAGYVLERRLFDRELAARAAAAGATVMVKTMATGLLREGDAICGVRVNTPRGVMEIMAKVVIAADGVGSLTGRWAGLDTRLRPQDVMSCAQYLLTGVDIDPECTYYYLDQNLAPGGYIWIFPKGPKQANVGLGVQADLRRMTPREYLDRFIAEQPSLAQGSPLCLVVGGVPVCLPPENIVTDGLMLVGDAARQVDPLTGGGIANGMTAGKMAAEAALEALEVGDTSASSLSHYQMRWAESVGRRMARNYRLVQRFPPEERDSERFLHLFAMSVGGGK